MTTTTYRAASVGTAGISSDDPEAIDKLRGKVAELAAMQVKMVAANKALRKGDDAALMALGFTSGQITKLKTPDFCGRVGFPDYATTNNSASIRRIRNRIKALEATQDQATTERTATPVCRQQLVLLA